MQIILPRAALYRCGSWEGVCAICQKKKTFQLFLIVMSNNIIQSNITQATKSNKSLEFSRFIANLKNSIWIFGIPCWLFGITDRAIASFADGYFSVIELFQLITASFFFVGWLYLKPEETLSDGVVDTIERYRSDSKAYPDDIYLGKTQARMLELQEYHLISQEYLLPFPYLCQIYHLLNLKHLESIHHFSLNNLRIVQVSHSQPTDIGGIIKFKTALKSPLNALRIWRQPLVEVGLILHTPYTVELSIPVYNNRYIIVIFNVLPINNNEHKLFIDIYSNLEWPKLFLQIFLHIASCLTLFEDLPYLRKLAERNLDRLVSLSKVSTHETMWLFKRFVELYGANLEPAQPMRASE